MRVSSIRIRDALLPAGLLSLARVALAPVFAATAKTPPVALGVLALAAATDVADGFVARRLAQVTTMGTLLDPIADKLFFGSVLATLVARGHASVSVALALLVREAGEAPLLVWLAWRRRAGDARVSTSNAAGKLTTTLQTASAAALLVDFRHAAVLVALAAASGFVAATTYWARALRGELAEETHG